MAVVVFHEWVKKLYLSLRIPNPAQTEELETLARNISQLDRLQRLKLSLMSSFPPSRPNQLECANLRSSFVQNLQIQSLQSLAFLVLAFGKLPHLTLAF